MPKQRHGANVGIAEHAPLVTHPTDGAFEATSSLPEIRQEAQQGTAGSSHVMSGANQNSRSRDLLEVQDPVVHELRREGAPQHWPRMDTTKGNTKEVAAARARAYLAEEIMGEAATQPVSIQGLVFPRWWANMHPAAPLLVEYARKGCAVSVGRDWTLNELEAAVSRGPHVSALEPDAIAQIQIEAREKVKQGFAKIVL